MNNYSWYQHLNRPSWAPPAWLFGPVWTVLYLIITVSFGTVFYKIVGKQIPLVVGIPFVLNMIFNLAFTPLQFGLRNNVLAAMDIALTLVTLIWAIAAIYPHVKWVAYAQIPYLFWVCFATVLQFTVTYLNR